MTRLFAAAVLALGLSATSAASAQSAISQDAHITEGLIAVGIADEIRSTCDSISPRMIRAYQFINGLWSHAREAGYSDPEIEAYVDSDTEKARLKGLALAYMTQNGVVPGDAESYCTLGRTEIAEGSAIGRLLRAK